MSVARITELDFLQIVYDHFKATGGWPDVRNIQLHIGTQQNARRFAAEIGSDKIICEEQPDGVCFLKLDGIALCKGSDRDIANFLGVIRMAASLYAESGRQKITSQEIQ